MSNLFLKNEINNFFNTETEATVSLPKWITVIDNANKTSDKTSAYSAQLGGNFSATSAISSTKDVNKLISMLTSDSSQANTSTDALESQLLQILNQDGGAKHNKQRGGNYEDAANIKKFFTNLKSSGVKVDVKLNDQSMSDFFGLAQTTTEIPSLSTASSLNINDIIGSEKQVGGARKKKGSKKSSKKSSKNHNNDLEGGARKKKGSKKSSKKSSKNHNNDLEGGARKKKGSKKSSKKNHNNDLEGGVVNAGFQAFLDLKKHVAQKLGISNGPKAAKVAGAVQKDMKEKYPDEDAVSIAKKGQEHFDKNMEHYKRMLN